MQVTKKEMQKEKSTNEGEEGVLVVFWLCSPRPPPPPHQPPLTHTSRSFATRYPVCPGASFIFHISAHRRGS